MADITPLPKGSYAIAHVQKSGYHLHTGRYAWSRFHIVKVTKATREGLVKEFVDNAVTSAPCRVDRFTTIYSVPEEYRAAAPSLFAGQGLDFTGYEDKAQLKQALIEATPRGEGR